MPPRSTAPTKTSKPRRQFAPHKPFVPTDANIMERAAAHYQRIAQLDRRPGIKIWAAGKAFECRQRASLLKYPTVQFMGVDLEVVSFSHNLCSNREVTA